MAQLKGTYKEIINITVPLIIGNLCNTLIAVFDVIFMSHYDKHGNTDLATIGYVTMFYLVLVLVGYNFSKGAQILIAKSTGEGEYKKVGSLVDHSMVMLLILSAVLCVFLMLCFKPLFALVVHNEGVANEGALFMTYRAPGIIFNFAGLVLISYFSGTNRTKILGITMFVMSTANILLNYILIFGHWGFPEMGIAGSGLASMLAEVISFIVLIFAYVLDKQKEKYQPFRFKFMRWEVYRNVIKVSLPLVGQSLIGFISWIVFFGFIANLGERQLAVSNVVKSIYQVIAIPSWSLANALNTVIGNITGQKKSDDVSRIVKRFAILSVGCSALICSFLFIFPDFWVRIFTGKTEMIAECREPLMVVAAAMMVFAVSVIILNTIVSIGSTISSLTIEIISIAIYLVYTFFVFFVWKPTLTMAWTTEIVYWILIGALSYIYLKRFDWRAKYFQQD